MKTKKTVLQFIVFSILLFIWGITFGQDSTGTGGGTGSGDNPITNAFTSLVLFAAAGVLVTGWLNTHLFKLKNPQVISWIVGVALACLGHFMQWGMFASIGWAWTVLYGIAAGFISNGIADINVVNMVLELLQAKLPKTK